MASFYATIARLYDSEHYDKTEDLLLYSELAETNGDPVLVVGSGTGRVALHLAQEGHTVHGIEVENAMLERARRKLAGLPHLQGQVTLHQGDALKLALDEQFGLVIIPYNTFMHFHSPAAHLGLLRRIRQWTRQSGVLVIDLPNAGEAFAGGDTEGLTLERTFIEQETGNLVMQQSTSQLDRAEQLMSVTWVYDEIGEDGIVRRTVAPMVIRYYFLAEMRLLLSAAGFELDEVYGDFDGTPFEDGVPRMILLAK